ncbi:MAG: hypothetical protein Q4F66_10210 [Clostridium sp.]|nr:hypothetical protein [Clostridium sp.]
MSNYMSQYEEYYKNINKKNNKNNNKQASRYFPGRRRDNKPIYSSPMAKNEQVRYFSRDYWFRRIISELSGAMIILVLFMGFKYIKNDYIQQAYRWSKNVMTSSFNYDQTIEAFNNSEIGTVKISELNIGGITVEDLKSEKISSRVNNLIEYLKNKMIIER